MDVTIGGGNRRLLQHKTCRKDGWTKARRTVFLETLARTCNVRLSAETAGMNPTGAHALRRRDPGFAALWREALAGGYDRLEEALLSHALQGINAITIGAEDCPEADAAAAQSRVARLGADLPHAGNAARATAMDVQLALSLFNRHRAAVEGTPPKGRGRLGYQPLPSPEATDAALRKKLDILARKLKVRE